MFVYVFSVYMSCLSVTLDGDWLLGHGVISFQVDWHLEKILRKEWSNNVQKYIPEIGCNMSALESSDKDNFGDAKLSIL